jgi:hypothetical protein
MAIDPLAEKPTFKLKEELKGLELTNLNDFFDAYADFKVANGQFSLYTEIAARNGDFLGYTKPFFVDLKVDKSAEENKTFFKKIWANIVAATGWVLKNHEKDQVASRVPIHGSFEKVNVDIWASIGSLLKNAFIEALYPGLDSSVSISSVDAKPAGIKDMKNRSSREKQK